MKTTIKITAYVLSLLCLLLNLFLFLRLDPPFNFYFVIFQLVAAGLAPLLILVGGVGAALGWFSRSRIPIAAGILGAGISIVYMILVTTTQSSFAEAFGPDWESRITPTQAARMIQRHWQPGLPQADPPDFRQNVTFWTIPASGRTMAPDESFNEESTREGDRKLLCDIWLPPGNVQRSGVAFVYLHGSAWYLLDKDYGTRPLFKQLTAQGHVVMDVAYRLMPEVDIYGMVGDVKRAVAWMKESAGRYGVNPDRIVLAGASAGGHLALLAAYTPDDPRLTPSELAGRDLSVRAVVSLYGPTDLRVCYEYLDQKRLIGQPKVAIGQPGAATMEKNMGDAGRLDMLLGGHLHEVPEVYALASPVTHVGKDAPPTLLIQGEPDVITPTTATRELHARLSEAGVPAVNIMYPLTNHAFDLLFPQISPPAQSALYYLERFLALMV